MHARPDPMPVACILAGGLGTRLRAAFPSLPKALVPVLGRPFLEWQVAWLHHQHVTRVHLAAGHMADQLAAWCAKTERPGLTLSQEPRALGTAGAVRFAAAALSSDPLLVINGDTFLPGLVLADLLVAHRRTGATVTIAATRIEEAGRYGTLEFDASGRLTAFREKADRAEGWVNGGVYAIQRSMIASIPADRSSSLESDIFPALASEGSIFAHRAEPPLLDMGTPEGLEALAAYLRQHPDFPSA